MKSIDEVIQILNVVKNSTEQKILTVSGDIWSKEKIEQGVHGCDDIFLYVNHTEGFGVLTGGNISVKEGFFSILIDEEVKVSMVKILCSCDMCFDQYNIEKTRRLSRIKKDVLGHAKQYRLNVVYVTDSDDGQNMLIGEYGGGVKIKRTDEVTLNISTDDLGK